MRQKTESRLVRAVLDYLGYQRIPCWRNNTGCVTYQERGRARIVRYGVVGGADILAVLPPSGRLLAIECKTVSGRQTAAQREFERAVTEAGALYVVARNLDDVADALR